MKDYRLFRCKIPQCINRFFPGFLFQIRKLACHSSNACILQNQPSPFLCQIFLTTTCLSETTMVPLYNVSTYLYLNRKKYITVLPILITDLFSFE